MAEWKSESRFEPQPFSPGELVRRLETVLRRVSTAEPVRTENLSLREEQVAKVGEEPG